MTEVARLEAVVSGRDVGLASLLTRVEAELRSTDAAAQRTTQETLKLATSYAQLARGLGEPAAGAAQLRSTLGGLADVTTRQELAIRRQIATLDQQAAKLGAVGPAGERAANGLRNLSSAANTVTNALGAIGIGVGIQQLVNFGSEAITLSNKTRTADAALRALAGSPKLYADALAVAREQQKLFGGSLEENISGVQGLITVSRSSGVELSKLIDLSQRLSVKDPGQGAAGARIALQEAFSGDPTSLAKRYEIPKTALKALKDESLSASDKLKILDTYLNQIGITSEVASGSIPKTAIAMNQLSAGAEAAKVSLGTLLAEGLAPLAERAGAALQGVASGLSSFSKIGAQQQQITAQLVGGAQSYDQYAAANKRANDQIAAGNAQFSGALGFIGNLTTQIPTLTQSQFALAQAMTAQGASSQEAALAVQQYGAQIAQLNPQQEALALSLIAQGQGFSQVVETVAPLGTVLAEIGTVYQELITSGQANEQSAAALAARMSELSAVGGPVAATIAALADGFLGGTISADQLTAALGQLEQAQALVTTASGANAAAIAAQEGATRSVVSAVTEQNAALGEQLVAMGAAEAKTRALAEANAQIASLGGAVANGLLTMASAASQLANQYGITEAAARSLIAAQAGIASSARLAQQRDDSQQRRASGGPQDASKGALEFVAKQERAAEAAQERRAREARKGRAGGGGGGGGIPPAVKLQQDTNNKIEDLERAHQDKLAQIAADGAQKRAAADRSFTRQQLTGRASFYRNLANVEDQATRQRLSAQFEAVQQEAAALRQTQGADVAQQYSEAATAAIERQAEIERAIAEARDKGDTGQAEYLQGVLELQKAADQDELDNIKNKGSAIAAEQARQYAEQETAYEAHLEKLGIAFSRKAAQIPGLAGSLPTVPTPPLPPPSTVANAQAAAQAPPPIQSPDKVQAVADVATPAAVDQQTSQLGAKLDAISSALSQVKAAIDSVRGAVDNLKRSGATAGG